MLVKNSLGIVNSGIHWQDNKLVNLQEAQWFIMAIVTSGGGVGVSPLTSTQPALAMN